MGKKNGAKEIKEKILSHGVRITTYLSGTKKNRFLLDQMKIGMGEGEYMKYIMDIHYSLIKQIPTEISDRDGFNLKEFLDACVEVSVVPSTRESFP